MQSQTPEQEKDKGLIAKGKELYGPSFSQIYAAFSELQPFMTDIAGCLEALVNRQPIGGARQKEGLEQAGHTLAGLLAAKFSWAQQQAKRQRAIRIGPGAVDELVQEAFENHGLAHSPPGSFADPYLAEWPPGRQHTRFGRRPYTGQTEQPGSKPGYDPRSLPPRRS